LKAKKSYTITVPRSNVSGIPIIRMVPEGNLVRTGDVLVQLDTTQAFQLLEERRNALRKATADLESKKAVFASSMMQLENARQSEQYSYEQAKLSYEQMEFEAGAKRRQQALRLRQAELSLQQAKARIAAQQKIQQTNREQTELQIQGAKLQLEQAQSILEALTMKSPGDGLVIYKETKGSGGVVKIKLGDMVWYGQDIMDVSDLAVMQVKTKINELDASQLAVGQQVILTMESLPGATFYGTVSQIATLATRRRNSDLKDFDVVILVSESDPRLKPGMSVNLEIITDRLENALYVPIEAVFEKEGRTVVYRAGSTEPVEVKLGPQNGNSVVIASGVRGGERICLRDPTLPLEVIGAGAPPKTGKK
jgi:RND family efflux transporter MFP subunit